MILISFEKIEKVQIWLSDLDYWHLSEKERRNENTGWWTLWDNKSCPFLTGIQWISCHVLIRRAWYVSLVDEDVLSVFRIFAISIRSIFPVLSKLSWKFVTFLWRKVNFNTGLSLTEIDKILGIGLIHEKSYIHRQSLPLESCRMRTVYFLCLSLSYDIVSFVKVRVHNPESLRTERRRQYQEDYTNNLRLFKTTHVVDYLHNVQNIIVKYTHEETKIDTLCRFAVIYPDEISHFEYNTIVDNDTVRELKDVRR